MPAPVAALSLMAHQGGWDEVAVVALPIAIFAVLLAMANRRASRAQARRLGEAPEDPQPPS